MAVRCGTCAWADHQFFYPKSVRPEDRLSYYAEFFPVVEVDSTYYRIPEPRHAVDWVARTPDDFSFDVKAYRTLTRHDRGQASALELERDCAAYEQVVDVLAEAGKLGLVLFQFPPWFVRSEANIAYAEDLLGRFSQFPAGVEFRHRSWWLDEQRAQTSRWLQDVGAVNVVCDEPQTGSGTIPFVPDVTSTGLVVFRLHGRNAETWYQKGLTSSQQRFDYKYSQTELAEFLPSVRQWTESAREVHILMNNNQADYAVANAFDWLHLLGLTVRERPVLLAPERSTQMALFDPAVEDQLD